MKNRISLFGHSNEEFDEAYHGQALPDLRLRYDLKLYWLIEEQINNGTRTFITGLRDGIDSLLASYVLDCRRVMPEKAIKLHVVLAYPEQADASPAKRAILEMADSCECIGDAATPYALQQQARRMIDLCTHMLAVYFDASREEVCAYATACGIEVLAYNPREIIRASIALKHSRSI